MTQHSRSTAPSLPTPSGSPGQVLLNAGLRPAVVVALLAALLAVFLLSLAVGSVNIPLEEVVKTLLGGEATRPAWTSIVLQFRLPKALTALLAGAALAVGGLQMQTFFRNPLAEPFVLGVSAGASLGVALVVLSLGTVGGTLLAGFGLAGDLGLAAAASVGAAVVMLLVVAVARRVQGSMTLLVLGLMISYLTGALVNILLHFSIAERIQAYVNWTFGSFGGVTWTQMPILAGAVMGGLLLAVTLAKPLNALLLGEAYAHSMGVNVRRAQVWIVISTALLAGAVTAFCGPIGFIGIAVPHLCRGVFATSDHRVLIPASVLVGALAALLAALLAELPGSPLLLPLNAVTALTGAPVVIWVVMRQRSLQRAFAA